MTQVPPSRATLADVLAAVQTAPMAERRRQDMASAVRAVARVLGRSLAAIPADLRGLNARLKHASPKAIGLTASRWNNARSLLRSALVLIGPMMEGRTVTPVSEAWARFYCLVNVRRDRVRLSRLIRWLSFRHITPGTVTAADIRRFYCTLTEEALLRDPEKTWADTANAWNRAVVQVQDWPQLPISRQSRQKTYSLPWTAFPPSLKQDVDGWLARLAGLDFAAEGPVRPLGEVTLKSREYLLRVFASALVLRGRDPATLTSLAACVTIENYTEGLRFFYERLGKKPTATTGNIATMLKGVARHWVTSDDVTLTRMTEITRKLSITYAGMTQKNRERLLPFNDLESCEKLLALPLLLRREIETGRFPITGALYSARSQWLSNCLSSCRCASRTSPRIEIDRHLIKAGKKLMLTIPSDEVKNRQPISTSSCPMLAADLIRWYLKGVRQADPGNPFLFPAGRRT